MIRLKFSKRRILNIGLPLMAWILLISVLTGISSCDENQPQFTLSRSEVGDKVVLVEEFSGVRCPNCPEGTKSLEDLKVIYGDQLIILTIHAGDFAFAYPNSRFDFASEEGKRLLQFLGNPIGYPSAVINRVLDGNRYQALSSKWTALITRELAKKSLINLTLNTTFDPAQRSINSEILAVPLEDIHGSIRFHLLIKENNLVDPQADAAANPPVVEDYRHRNVFRSFISSASGDLVAQGSGAFNSLTKSYQFTVPQETGWWKAEDLWLVAFVTNEMGEVLQATEQALVP